MNTKSEKLHQAANKIKTHKALYHVITPISDEKLEQIKASGYFDKSKDALGGQSNGYYFFTTKTGVDNHIKTMQDSWYTSENKHPYIIECEINANDIKYPDWKLDYEAMQDFLFNMIYDAALRQSIKIDDIEITALENRKLSIIKNGKFSRIKSFTANEHSGLIEKVSDFLYKHNKEFKTSYDKLLSDVFFGNGSNQELYAVKTNTKQKITKITKIEKEPTAVQTQTNSQIDKFLSRYSRSRK
jgi:hypothetical protein